MTKTDAVRAHDLVKQLRHQLENVRPLSVALVAQAADELERLRAERDALAAALNARDAAAIEERDTYERMLAEEKSRRRVAEECAVELRDALQALYDEQNDAPLERYRAKWEAAMAKAEAALAKNPAPAGAADPEDSRAEPPAKVGAGPTSESVYSATYGPQPVAPEYPQAAPPYPFCCHPEKCCATGRCERRVGGELRCCAD